MQYFQAKQGRTFILRLEDGEIVHEVIEEFAVKHHIKAAALIILGGAAPDSRLVVGPENGAARPIIPMQHLLQDVHEISGTGTLFPDEAGQPILHMHMACGRQGDTVTGCIRSGVRVWQIMEVVVFEIEDISGVRVTDAQLGFKLLNIPA